MNKVKFITQEQANLLYIRLSRPHKLIFALGMETGLRISDILRLRTRDIENPITVYVGRTKELRAFPLSEWLFSELISYADNELPERYIFASQRKRRRSVSRTTYHRHIKRALTDLDFDCSAHSTRKLFYSVRAPVATPRSNFF